MHRALQCLRDRAVSGVQQLHLVGSNAPGVVGAAHGHLLALHHVAAARGTEVGTNDRGVVGDQDRHREAVLLE